MIFQDWYSIFTATGEISPVYLGMPDFELRQLLDEPNDIGAFSGKPKKPAIWRYGSLEFHFDHANNGQLFLIYRNSDEGLVEICIQGKPDA